MSSSPKIYMGEFEGLPVIGSTRAAVELVLAVAAGKTDVAKTLKKTIIDEASTYNKTSSVAASSVKEAAGDVQEVAEKDVLPIISCGPKKAQKQQKQLPEQKKTDILKKVREDTLKKFGTYMTAEQMNLIIDSGKRSRRGEHVINNDVLAFYRKSIERFLENRHAHIQVLKGRFADSRLWLDCDNLVPPDCHVTIRDEMVAHFDDNELYINANAIVYGTIIPILHEAVQNCLASNDQNPDAVQRMVQYININEVYVDLVARLKWEGNNLHKRAKFEACRDEVIAMYERLYNDGGAEGDFRMRRWARELNRFLAT